MKRTLSPQRRAPGPAEDHDILEFHGCKCNTCRIVRLVAFYVTEHNSVMPHAAFNGQTPDEVYFGTGDQVAPQLARRRTEARQARLAANRMVACAQCRTDGLQPESSAISDMVHLHTQKSQMS